VVEREFYSLSLPKEEFQLHSISRPLHDWERSYYAKLSLLLLLRQTMGMSSTPTSGKTVVEYVEEKTNRSSLGDSTEARCDACRKREETTVNVPEYSTWSRAHDVAFIVSVCLAQFLSLATLAQTVTPILVIRDSLNIQSPGQLAWLTSAYSMTLGTFILPSGIRINLSLNDSAI
jgi:hypothetical protein